jgi:mevalonate pyrophosphate decarboxylase
VGVIYLVCFAAVAAAVLFCEHRILTPNDLSRINRVFSTLNGGSGWAVDP